MNFKQIIGALVFVGGLVLLYLAHYINVQIEQGNTEIFAGQKRVDDTNALFDRTPATKPIGRGLTSGGQRQIDEGRGTIEYYTVVAQRCQIGGIVALIVGAGMMVFLRNKKRHS
jgi:hypothetical protein